MGLLSFMSYRRRGRNSAVYLAPSAINYIYSEHSDLINDTRVDKSVLELAGKIVLTNADLPKIQAVEKDGKWFTLNNAQLDLCRRLQGDGKCSKVKVDVVPLSGVPQDVRRMMVIPPSPPPTPPPPPPPNPPTTTTTVPPLKAQGECS